MDDRIAVLGGTGYVGQRVAAALLAAGRAVTIIARRPPSAAADLSMCDFSVCDARDGAALMKTLRFHSHVVNAVAGSPSAIVEVAHNLAGLPALAGQLPIEIVHISTLAVFGQTIGLLGETTSPVPARGHAYAAAKLHAETMLRAARPATTILRPGCIYGAAAPVWSDRIGRLLLRRRLGDLGVGGSGWCNIVHVDDVAAAVLRALDGGAAHSGMHHLLPPEKLTWNDFLRRFAAHLGIPKLPRMTRWRMQVETNFIAPASYLRHPRHGASRTIITPAMRRMFRCRAMPVSQRPPLLHRHEGRTLDAALAEIATSLLTRDAAAAPFAAPIGLLRMRAT